MHNIADHISALRRLRNVTIASLAERLQLPETYLSGIEAGKVNVDLNMVEKIGEALDFDVVIAFLPKVKKGK